MRAEGLRARLGAPLLIAAGLGVAHGAPAAELELVATEPSELFLGWVPAGEAAMELVDSYGRYTVAVSWTPPPPTLGPEGFGLTLEARATGLSEYVYAGIGASSDGGLAFEGSPHIDFKVEAGESAAQSVTVRVTPRDEALLELGQRVRLTIGPANGPGVSYYYQVVATGGPLQVSHDCPPEIVISALPSVNCHLIISGFRRNTADPIIVSLPQAVDTFGNHPNGIQVLGQGEEDVFQWDDPHSWGLFVFACPSQDGTGANCYDSATAPGPVTVPILVQQGSSPPVQVDLAFTAVPHP